jgi:hypothetical protein
VFVKPNNKSKGLIMKSMEARTLYLKGLATKFGISNLSNYNSNIFDTDFLNIPKEFLPGKNARVEWRVLFATWKREAHVDELKNISGQVAGVLKSLRRRGFIQVGKGSLFYVNKTLRSISGWQTPFLENRTFIKLSSKARKEIFKNRRDVITRGRNRNEIDHRTPVSACIRLGIQPAELTTGMINEPGWEAYFDKYFQCISIYRNADKRELCAKCLSGGDILLPEIAKELEKYKGPYKKRWDSLNTETKSCVGCFYYDPQLSQEEYLANKVKV